MIATKEELQRAFGARSIRAKVVLVTSGKIGVNVYAA